jgi:hypothetical protein
MTWRIAISAEDGTSLDRAPIQNIPSGWESQPAMHQAISRGHELERQQLIFWKVLVMEFPVASSCKIKLHRECGSFEAPPKWESLHGVAEIALDRARSKTPDPRRSRTRIPLGKIVLDEITKSQVVARKIGSVQRKVRSAGVEVELMSDDSNLLMSSFCSHRVLIMTA